MLNKKYMPPTVHYLLGATHAPSLVLIKWKGQKILSGQHTVPKSGLTLTFEHVTWNSIESIYSGTLTGEFSDLWRQTVINVQLHNMLNKKYMPPTVHYLLGATHAPSLVLIKWKGQKILSGQHTVPKSGLTLTFEHVTWNSIESIYSGTLTGEFSDLWRQTVINVQLHNMLNKKYMPPTVHYLLGATHAPSLVLIKWKGQKILSGQHTVFQRAVWPWPLNMWPENQ